MQSSYEHEKYIGDPETSAESLSSFSRGLQATRNLTVSEKDLLQTPHEDRLCSTSPVIEADDLYRTERTPNYFCRSERMHLKHVIRSYFLIFPINPREAE